MAYVMTELVAMGPAHASAVFQEWHVRMSAPEASLAPAVTTETACPKGLASAILMLPVVTGPVTIAQSVSRGTLVSNVTAHVYK